MNKDLTIDFVTDLQEVFPYTQTQFLLLMMSKFCVWKWFRGRRRLLLTCSCHLSEECATSYREVAKYEIYLLKLCFDLTLNRFGSFIRHEFSRYVSAWSGEVWIISVTGAIVKLWETKLRNVELDLWRRMEKLRRFRSTTWRQFSWKFLAWSSEVWIINYLSTLI